MDLHHIRNGGTNDYNKSFRLHCIGLHTIWMDNKHYYHGDIYSSNHIFTNFIWKKGKKKYKIAARVRYKGVLPRFTCTLSKMNSRATLYSPLNDLKPDIVNGVLISPYIPLTISNSGEDWLNHIELRPSNNNNNNNNNEPLTTFHLNQEEQNILQISKGIAPSQTIVIPIHVQLLKKPNDIMKNIVGSSGELGDCIKMNIDLFDTKNNKILDTTSFYLRCRHGLQSHTFTFKGHDGSISSASLIRPRNKCIKKKCGVLLSLSGVGVSPSSQADAHKYQDSHRRKRSSNSKLSGSEWTFGMTNAWVLCPGRQGAHNFEGTGLLVAMESLNALKNLKTVPKDKQVDITRVVYAGHSRGGHGSLLLGVKMPDVACGIVASNGWIRREYYADANPIFEHDLSLSHAFPFVIRQVFESSISENDVGLTHEYIVDIPITIRTCSDDQSVSPWFMRRMARILSSNHVVDLEFRELDNNLGHWWWNTKKTNDGGALFDAYLRKRYKSAFKSCNNNIIINNNTFVVVSLIPSTFHGKHGIRILSQDRTMSYSKIYCTLNNMVKLVLPMSYDLK